VRRDVARSVATGLAIARAETQGTTGCNGTRLRGAGIIACGVRSRVNALRLHDLHLGPLTHSRAPTAQHAPSGYLSFRVDLDRHSCTSAGRPGVVNVRLMVPRLAIAERFFARKSSINLPTRSRLRIFQAQALRMAKRATEATPVRTEFGEFANALSVFATCCQLSHARVSASTVVSRP
jgi:hypothetical protein